MILRRLLVPVLLLFVPCALAQFGNPDQTGNLRVRIVFENGRQCHTRARVTIMTGASTTRVAEGYTNDDCMVGFDNLAIGTYHIAVTGDGIQETDSGIFEVDSRKISQLMYVTVKTPAKDKPSAGGGATVSAADLNIPKRAQKEFDKANDLIAKQDWKRAKDELMKAITIYPPYADAYNNLGVVYSRLGESAQEREVLQKAVSLNDHCASAFVNLGKMDIKEHNFSEAQTHLEKAAALEGNNPQTLMLLANVELMNQYFDAAIAHCQKVHTLPHDSQTLVHYIAARALEHENRSADAAAEFHRFLQEEPTGPRADAVRKELSGLENVAH